MRHVIAVLILCGTAGAASAQSPSGQSVANASTFGAVAALAPLCGLRDEAWAQDLRRAARQQGSGGQETDDSALNALPGHGELGAALGYGEMEALEDLASKSPPVACAELGRNPALARADAAVWAFRLLKAEKPVG